MEEEEILWTGKPHSKVPFLVSMLLICQTVVVSVIDIVILISGIEIWCEKGSIPSSYFLLLIFPFLVAVLPIYKMIIEKKIIWKNTTYVVTDKRVLVIIIGKRRDMLIEKSIRGITYVGISDVSVKDNGKGTLIFGRIEFPYVSSFYTNSKNEYSIKYSCDGDTPIFNDIDDAMEVFEIIDDLRNNK